MLCVLSPPGTCDPCGISSPTFADLTRITSVAGTYVLPYGEGACTRGLIVSVSPQETAAYPRGKTIRACDWALSSSSVPNGLLEGAAIVILPPIFGFVPQKGDKLLEKGLGCF